MSDPNTPWISDLPPDPAPAPYAPPAASPPHSPPARPPEPPPVSTPLAKLKRQADLAVILSIVSFFCGAIVLNVVALVVVFRAQAEARTYGATPSIDASIQRAKVIAIAATALWVLILLVVVIAGAGSSSSSSMNSF